MGGRICIAVIAIFVFSYHGLDAQLFNLPKTVLPEKYTLLIYTNLNIPQPFFFGYIYIDVHCAEKTSEIILHAKDLQIVKHQVTVGLIAKKALKMQDVSDVQVIESRNQLVIFMKKDLKPKRKYRIFIHYFKSFAPDFTEYQIRIYTGNNKSIKAAFTNFGSGGAPAVFPCFNNMNFKSKFQIHLAHPKGILGFSNMPRMNMDNTDLPFFKDWVMDVFKESVPMSTFEVNFALVNMSGPIIIDGEKDVPIGVWSLLGSKQIDKAGEKAHEAFQFYTKYFASDYSLPKLDILVLPNLGGKDNEKFGLSTIGENTILYPNQSFGNEEFDVARSMCHVVSHQWIGSYVTMTSWSESWFHEALSDYLEEPCTEEIINSAHTTDRLELKVVQNMVWGLNYFETLLLPVSVYAEHQNSVTQGFNSSLPSEKAFFLVRMLKFFVGEKAFQNSLIAYMKTFGLSNSSLNQVWKIFTREGEKAGTLLDITVDSVMDSWIKKPFYPLLRVKRDFESNLVTVKQEPFTAYMTKSEIESITSNDNFMFPMNVIRQKFLVEGQKVPFNFWLKRGEFKVRIGNDAGPNEWVLFNTQMNVLSRTDYDRRTWELIQASLLDGKQFSVIDPLTRAHLISDIFELSRAEISEISYDFALETIKYLKFEDKHCVWFVALLQIRLIYRDFVGTQLYKPFKKYIREIMTLVFKRKEFSKINNLPAISAEKSLKRQIVDASCVYGVKDCRKQCKELFKDWYTKSINGEKDAFSKIPVAIRDIVLSYGIRKTDHEHWDHLLNEYRKYGNSPKIRREILEALGCSKKEETLKKYLNMSLDSKKIFKIDSLIVFESLSKNKVGYPLMEEFLRSEYKNIEAYRSDDDQILGSYMKTLILAITRREDLDKLKISLEEIIRESPKYKNVAADSYDKADIRIGWYERNEKTFKDFFDKVSPPKKSKKEQSSPKLDALIDFGSSKNKEV